MKIDRTNARQWHWFGHSMFHVNGQEKYLSFFSRSYFGISFPSEQGIFIRIPINMFYITDIEIVIADIDKFAENTVYGDDTMNGNLNIAIGNRLEFDGEIFHLISCSSRRTAALHDLFCQRFTRNGQYNLFACSDCLASVGCLHHGKANNLRLKTQICPPGYCSKIGHSSGGP
mgnify:CR=1 FL=1